MGAWSRPFRDRQEEEQAKDEWFACEGWGVGGGRGGALVSDLSIPVGRETTPCRAAGVEERWALRLGEVALETPLDTQVEAPQSRRRYKSGIREGESVAGAMNFQSVAFGQEGTEGSRAGGQAPARQLHESYLPASVAQSENNRFATCKLAFMYGT